MNQAFMKLYNLLNWNFPPWTCHFYCVYVFNFLRFSTTLGDLFNKKETRKIFNRPNYVFQQLNR